MVTFAYLATRSDPASWAAWQDRRQTSESELVFYCEQRRGSKGAYGRRRSVEQTSKEGGHMEREKLERAIHQLTQIIGANAFALASKSTPITDRAGLQKQIAIRTTLWAGLLKQLNGHSILGTAN